MGKQRMTPDFYKNKMDKLQERAVQLQQEMSRIKERIKANEEEIQKTEAEFILESFKSTGMSISDYINVIQNQKPQAKESTVNTTDVVNSDVNNDIDNTNISENPIENSVNTYQSNSQTFNSNKEVYHFHENK